MVQHKDLMAYLLAIKTFALRARPARIIVVADPSLDQDDMALMRCARGGRGNPQGGNFQRPAIPVGGTWERLAAIAALNAECSIVQLDSDTVTLGEVSEVVEAACAGRSFVLRPEPDEQIVDLATATVVGRRKLEETRHIQAMAEARLTDLPDSDTRRYVRGCSGFTGFRPRGADPVGARRSFQADASPAWQALGRMGLRAGRLEPSRSQRAGRLHAASPTLLQRRPSDARRRR
jgi:hypothetical protein